MTTATARVFGALRGVILLVVIACATPGSASAGCGDYVTILSDPHGSAHHAIPAHGESTAPLMPPCHGPNCTELPVKHHAPLAPITTVGPQVKELAETLVSVGGTDHPPSSFDRITSTSRPVRRATSLFHPPRIG